nr:gamma-glutamyltransferase family protein [Roseospira visakhapatnamensis]
MPRQPAAPSAALSPYLTWRAPVLARNIVATSQPLAAQAGLRMLLHGGNAIDAALAAAMALVVVEPTGCGLGSDAFAIVWDGHALHGLNASGRSPAGWTPERFRDHAVMPTDGIEAVTVPGAVSAWAALSARFGRLPLTRVAEPAIGYAREGFPVSPTIADGWARGAVRHQVQPGFADAFLPHGRAPRPGELFRHPALAASLESIADSAGESFYRGDLARRMAAFSASLGGALTEADLDAHRCDWVETLSRRFVGVELHEIPPNGQGLAALIALGILAHTSIAHHPPDSADALHLQIEAMKLALADAYRYIADPAAMDTPVTALLDAGYLFERAREIDLNRAGDPGAGQCPPGGTVYVAAADASGMMVSFIQSNYMGFGSGLVVPDTGISLQNRGAGFTLEPGHPNRVGPGKRPFQTIIPGFVTAGGRPRMSFGVMGGPIQAQGHVQIVLRTQLHGQSPQAACDAPRWRVDGGLSVAVEPSLRETVRDQLARRGHRVSVEGQDASFGFGGAQIIQCLEDGGGYGAGSDHRKDGQAVGF